MYIQPEMMVSPVTPQNIICTSSQFGGNSSELGEGEHTAEAPARDPKVF